MPTPEVSWPFAPKGEPGIGVFIMDLGKLNAPLSRSLHMVQTLAFWMLSASFEATAAAQLANPEQYAGFKAAWKKGCEVTAARFLSQLPPARPALPPQNCITIWPYALAKDCPPRVIM